MIRSLLAWKEIIKLGSSSKTYRQVDDYFRDNVMRVLDQEGVFNYLKEPKTVYQIIDNFNFTDRLFLELVLDALEKDNSISRVNGTYQSNGNISISGILPEVFNESIMDLLSAYAQAIPDRMRGKYIDFSEGFNLFNWDDALSTTMYEQIRKGAFAYVNPLKKPGKLLDIGCGNGWGTAAIWTYYYKRSLFLPKNKYRLKIFAIEPDRGLLKIAEEEFPKLVKTHIDMSLDEINQYKEYFPMFKHGSVNEIPFDDESFDYAYISQVLHWTDPVSALEELNRIVKPGGVVFGTENFVPQANPFTNLHIKVIENAYGFFTKEAFTKWAKMAGFKKIRYSTPVTIFRLDK